MRSCSFEGRYYTVVIEYTTVNWVERNHMTGGAASSNRPTRQKGSLSTNCSVELFLHVHVKNP